MSISPLFVKLNLKDQTDIVVLNAPKSFEPELSRLRGVAVHREVPGRGAVGFALAFVMRQAELDSFVKTLAKAAPGDAVLWFAYPKGSSKRYTCEINRETGWRAVGAAGFEGVRMVAIDEDWTAARFRRVEFIKTMKRHASGAMSAVGKARVAKKAR